MKSNKNQIIRIGSGFAVPFITLLSPEWLAVSGVTPAWSILWLIPFALTQGPYSGCLAGLCLGLSLDALRLEEITQVPALFILGFFWGVLGQKDFPAANPFNIGFLAWTGTVFLSFTLGVQQLFFNLEDRSPNIANWFWHTLLAHSIITGLLSPLICSWLLFYFRKRN
tara:strand:+ start:230 stop:733 length:504 start_codon:yes stop_codon:yes gene_type:complete